MPVWTSVSPGFRNGIIGSISVDVGATAIALVNYLSAVGVLLLTAGLSVFIALWSAVRERRGDMALLRMLGASPAKVALLLLTEGLWLGVLASILGLLLGQAFAAALAWLLQLDNSLLIGGMVWPVELWIVPCLALGVSLVSALLPAIGAYRVSVLELLQSR